MINVLTLYGRKATTWVFTVYVWEKKITKLSGSVINKCRFESSEAGLLTSGDANKAEVRAVLRAETS